MRLRHTLRVVLAVGTGGVIAAPPKDTARAAALLQPALAAGGAGVCFVDGLALASGGFVA